MSQSRENSTTKAYLRVIKRFLEWCKRKNLSVQLPFPVSTVSLYLFESHQSCASSASLIQTHAVLKWFHSFVPSLDRNPLDSEFCKNIIESAKRTKSKPVAKKKPFSSQIINNYSPKWRWLVVDIYRAAKRRGKYPTLATDTEVNSCFSIY